MKSKTYQGIFLPFRKARKKARTLGLKSRRKWEQLCRDKKRPCDLPACPSYTYARFGWAGYSDFLGYKKGDRFLRFDKAREFVRRSKLKSKHDWNRYCASGRKPANIPACPQDVYKKRYKGIRDWLGIPEKKVWPFVKARAYVRKAGLTSRTWWRWSSTLRPDVVPSRPDRTYKNKGWKSWSDWFGSDQKG